MTRCLLGFVALALIAGTANAAESRAHQEWRKSMAQTSISRHSASATA